MRFGKSKEEAEKEPSRSGSGGGDFIKYLMEGSTTFRIAQEPDEWCYYWEHFSPEGFSFACNDEEDCPGCISDNEKMKKVSRKIAFNVLQSWQGVDYVNVYKIGPMIADKLENRYKRLDTLTDRDYTITKYKTGGDRWDFDVEGGTPMPVDFSKYQMKDVESMLLDQWEEHWGAARPVTKQEPAPRKRTTIAPTPRPEGQSEEPPFEDEEEVKEADLRRMTPHDLRSIITESFGLTAPDNLSTSDELVDWLMDLQQS